MGRIFTEADFADSSATVKPGTILTESDFMPQHGASGSWDTAPQLDLVGSAWQGIKDLPSALMSMPSSIKGMGVDLYQTAISPTNSIGNGTAERAAREVGGTAAGIAGAGVGATAGAELGLLGGPAAPATVPLGALLGGALGFGAGILGFDKLNQATGSDPETSAADDLNRLAYNSAQGGAMGAVTAPVVKVGGAVIRPFTTAGQETIAGELLAKAAGQQGVKNLEAARPGDFGPLTYAEVAKTPGAANLQVAMSKELGDTGGNLLMQSLAERAATRNNVLQDLAPDAMSDVGRDSRGAYIRSLGEPAVTQAKADVSEAWSKAGNLGQRLPLGDAPLRLTEVADRLRTPLGFSGDAWKVVNAFFDEKNAALNSITIDDWQRVRSAAGEVMADAAGKGRMREAALMGEVRSQLDAVAEQAMGGGTPLQGKKLQALRDAIDQTRVEKQTFESGPVGNIFQKGEAGYRLPDSQIPQKIISTPEGAKGFMKAFGDNPEAVQQGRGALLDDMARKSPDTWPKYFSEKRSQFQALFADDFSAVKSVIDDLNSQQSVHKLSQQATGRGSITAQGLTAAKALSDPAFVLKMVEKGGRVAGATLGAGSLHPVVGAPIGYALGDLAARIAGKSKAQIQAIVVQGMRDAETAKLLTQKATPNVLNQLANKLMPYVSAPVEIDREHKRSQATLRLPQRSERGDVQTHITQQKQQLSRGAEIAALPKSATTPAASQAKYEPAAVKKMVGQLPPVVQAVIKTESNGDHMAVSPKGARGLMQLMPENVKKFGISDPHDPVENVKGGIALLQAEFEKWRTPEIALAAYNAGDPAIERAIKACLRNNKDVNWTNLRKYLPKEAADYPGLVAANLKTINQG